MTTLTRTPTLADPLALLDAAFAPTLSDIETALPWLTRCYGVATKLEKTGPDGKGKIMYPVVFAGGTEYIGLLPDESLGNYCWIDVEDGAELLRTTHRVRGVKAKAAFVFWLDVRKGFDGADPDTISVASLVDSANTALHRLRSPGLRTQVTRNWVRSEHIYRGYNVNEIEHQFLMRPYAGFRIDLDVVYVPESCTE